ncbi:MAG: type II toxin-antitoxin system RelE/ParE family toxin [Kiloniellales bacterium]
MTWRISFYSVALEQEILRMPAPFVARFIRYAERMETFGPDLGMPHTKALGDGLCELRLKGPRAIVRIFYCTCAGRRITMLHQYVKKSEKAPRKELDVARRRMREVKREIN